jgi:hypothetical protein
MKFAIIFLIIALMAVSIVAQTPPTLRIVTEDPNLPSELFYGNTKVKPLRLRPGTNQVITIDDSDFFVMQHYVDFLGRMPEPAGLQGWLNVLNGCGTTVPAPCDRIEVSGDFFRSEEFQVRRYFAYRLYSASFDRIPLYAEFIPDARRISGFQTDQQLEANRVALVNDFVARPEFINKYGATFNNPTAFVDALLNTVGFPSHPSRQSWINTLTSNNTAQTRAQVLRGLAESSEVYNKYYNLAFVIMQYHGYLRRDADIAYLHWVDYLNTHPGDYRTMINGFVNSSEYRGRF